MRFTHLRGWFLRISVCAALSGCITDDPTLDQPAHLLQPSKLARAELRETIEAALDIPVLLPPDALVKRSELIIARQPQRTLEQGLLLGTDLATPLPPFHLVRNNGHCVLVQGDNEKRWKLKKARCTPLE